MATIFYFPEMFRVHVGDSINLPEDMENYNPQEYPHWHVFLNLHLGNAINISSLEHNAEVIASFSDEEIKQVTLEQLIEKGLYIEASTYID